MRDQCRPAWIFGCLLVYSSKWVNHIKTTHSQGALSNNNVCQHVCDLRLLRVFLWNFTSVMKTNRYVFLKYNVFPIYSIWESCFESSKTKPAFSLLDKRWKYTCSDCLFPPILRNHNVWKRGTARVMASSSERWSITPSLLLKLLLPFNKHPLFKQYCLKPLL